MFCPHCGAKNASGAECFVCEKRLPNLDDSRPRASSSKSASKITSPTGEQIAALGDRFIAIILDAVFLTMFFGLAAVAAARFPQIQNLFPSAQWFNLAGAVGAFVVTFLYYWFLEGAFGSTLGKAIAGVQVRSVHHGGRIGLKSSLWRTLLRLIDGVGFYFLGYLVALFSRQRRRIGDFIAGTVVVQRDVVWAERATVLVLWLIGVAGFAWGAYTLCPRCVDLQVARVIEQIGLEQPSSIAPRPTLASN
jgi:uncharacterized RDD family membrane protein YckC